jgi:hypothetical protein
MSYQWPNSAAGTETDWIEFVVPDPDEKNRDPDYPNVRVRVNVSFMQSGWNCKFGDCPGILIHGAMTDVSCCQIGVGIEEGEEMARVRKAVSELTAADWDRAGEKDWYDKISRKDRAIDENGVRDPMFHTKVVDGGCILANRHGGPANAPGCALHVLAKRTDVHHSETKPDICWQIPFAVDEEWDKENWHRVLTVTGTPMATWGSSEMNGDLDMPGYWCTETPDAYDGVQPVYRYAETELRKVIGDKLYEEMANRLDGIRRRYPTAGEAANDGRKMLPLLVVSRAKQWQKEEMTNNIARSADYLRALGHIVLED